MTVEMRQCSLPRSAALTRSCGRVPSSCWRILLVASVFGLLCPAWSRGDSARIGLGPEGARIVCSAADSRIPGTLYIGTRTSQDEGFVYKSADGGKTWHLAGTPGKARPVAPTSLAIDPVDSRIVYAGTFGDAIYRSRDAGETWEVFPPGANAAFPRAHLSVDPFSSGVVYAATNYGFIKATASPPDIVFAGAGLPDLGQSIAADPNRPNVVYAGLNSGVVARSTDGGASWKVLKPLPTLNPYWVTALAVRPDRIGVVYAATFNGEVFGSNDDGASWTKIKLRVPGMPGEILAPINALAFDGSGNVFIGSSYLGLLKTTDGVVADLASTGMGSTVVNSLAFDRASGALYAGTQGGLFRSDDDGATWSARNSGLREIPYGVYVTAQPNSYLFARDWDTGLFRSGDRGRTWKRIVPKEDGRSIDVLGLRHDPTRPSILYAGFSFRNPDGSSVQALFKTEDSGETWRRLPLTTFIADIAVDPARPSNVYVASHTDGILMSVDGGSSWTPTSLTNLNCQAVALGPVGSSVVYARTFDKGMFRSDDGGATWTTMNNGLELALRIYFLTGFNVDPSDPNTIYVSIDALYRSRDGGRTWETVSHPGRMFAILPDPRKPTVLYASLVNGGLVFSMDGGVHWSALDTFSEWTDPGVSLTIDPEGGTLYVTTWSHGILALDIHGGRFRVPITTPCRPPCP